VRLRRWLPLLVGILALLGGSAQAAGAIAAVQDDVIPVSDVEGLEPRLDMLAQSGARVTRVDIFWADVAPTKPARPADPSDPAYRFAHADTVFTGLHERGIIPIVSVYNPPRWAVPGRRGAPAGSAINPNHPNPAFFGAFMEALARRYNGSFVSPVFGPLPSVRHFEIWNEPNLQLFYRPQFVNRRNRSIANYVKLVRAAYPRIKRANRRAIVIAGVGGPKSRTAPTGPGMGVGTLDWLRGIRRTRVRFDAYSQHIYPAAPPLDNRTRAVPSWNSIPLLLSEIDKIRRGMPLYITEAGYTTALTPFRRVRVTVAQQRTYLRQIFNLRSLRTPRIPVVVWFNLQDNRFWPGGLMRANGTAKPSLAAFKAVARRGAVPAALRP